MVLHARMWKDSKHAFFWFGRMCALFDVFQVRWPFCVSLDSGKCLVTVVAARLGGVVRLQCHIAKIGVDFVGDLRAACR